MFGINIFKPKEVVKPDKVKSPRIEPRKYLSPADEILSGNYKLLSEIDEAKKQKEQELLRVVDHINSSLKRGMNQKYPSFSLENIFDIYLLSNMRQDEVSLNSQKKLSLANELYLERSEFILSARESARKRKKNLTKKDYDVFLNLIRRNIPENVTWSEFIMNLTIWAIGNDAAYPKKH